MSEPGGRRLGYVLKRFPRISETFVASEILELERQGEHVVIFAVSRPDEPFRHAFLDQLQSPVIYLPHRPGREPLRVVRAVVRALRSSPRKWLRSTATLWPPRRAGFRRWFQAAVLRDEMARAGITHAHAHFATTAARLAYLAWRMGGPTYSVTAHAKDVWQQDVRPDRLRDKLLPAEFVATVSPLNCERLEQVLGPTARVHLVPNSVDVNHLRAGPILLTERVLTVARLVPKKGVGDVLDACELLVGRGATAEFEVIGDGPLGRQMRQHARALDLPVQFRGYAEHEEVLSAMTRSQVFCLPCLVADDGDRDGLPTAVLEAMALGVPVVTTAVNGLAEAVIHERTGLVVPERDPDAIADSILRLLKDPELAAALAAAARRHVEENYALRRSVGLLRSLFPGGPGPSGRAPTGAP